MKLLISALITVIADSSTSLKDSDGEVNPVSEGHGLFNKIHDILDKAVSK